MKTCSSTTTVGFVPQPPNTAGVSSGVGAPSRVESLRGFFYRRRRELIGDYALQWVESLLRVVQPLAVGLAINGLLTESYAGLIGFVGLHLLYVMVRTHRQRFEQRSFLRFSADAKAIRKSWIGLDLFETQIPNAISAVVSILGATMALRWFDSALVPFTLLLLVPALLLSSSDSRSRRSREASALQELQSDEGPLFDLGGIAARRMSEGSFARIGLMHLFTLATLVAVLIRFCTRGMQEPGNIFAVFCYVLVLAKALSALPGTIAEILSLRELDERASLARAGRSAGSVQTAIPGQP